MLAVEISSGFYHRRLLDPERNCRRPPFREMAPGVAYLLGSSLDALAVDALYRDTKDGDVLLVQLGKGIMQRDAQKMRRTRQV